MGRHTCYMYMYGVYIPILHMCMYDIYNIHVTKKFNYGGGAPKKFNYGGGGAQQFLSDPPTLHPVFFKCNSPNDFFCFWSVGQGLDLGSLITQKGKWTLIAVSESWDLPFLENQYCSAVLSSDLVQNGTPRLTGMRCIRQAPREHPLSMYDRLNCRFARKP